MVALIATTSKEQKLNLTIIKKGLPDPKRPRLKMTLEVNTVKYRKVKGMLLQLS